MKPVLSIIFFISLFGCAIKQSQEGSQVIAISEEDKQNCSYISEVVSGGSYFWGNMTYDHAFESGFNDALNEVASKGGDSYAIGYGNETGEIYKLEVWHCGWSNSKYFASKHQVAQPQEISASDRMQCNFIKSIAEGSSWGITESRNYDGAKRDALNHVREAGGDSYYIVRELKNVNGAGLIIEAWRCSE